jgi:hypothetical protein
MAFKWRQNGVKMALNGVETALKWPESSGETVHLLPPGRLSVAGPLCFLLPLADTAWVLASGGTVGAVGINSTVAMGGPAAPLPRRLGRAEHMTYDWRETALKWRETA